MTTTSRARRGLATLAVGALAAGTLGALGAAPAQAAPDPRPTAAGSTWLAGQLTDGLIVGEFGADQGLSIDAALALAAVGGNGAAVQEVADAVEAEVEAGNYVSGEAFGDAGSTYAGAVAKTVVLAQTAERDTDTYGGENLVTRLEGVVSSGAEDAGRLGDVSTFGDFANTIGQSFAARALDQAGSTRAGAVTDYLLAQQCEAGYFRLDLGDTAAANCDAESGAPSTDVTGLVVLNLLEQRDDPEVGAAVDAALTWLQQSQRPDGSFGSDAQIAAANANSTGLAGWALGEAGETAPAEAAAIWLRQRQVAPVAACPTALDDERGALAYDNPALIAGRGAGITDETRDQFRRAAAQALPALRWAPDQPATPVEPTLPSGFVRAGSSLRVVLGTFVPGDTVCVVGSGQRSLAAANADGLAAPVVSPRAGDQTYVATSATGAGDRVTVRALGSAKLRVGLSRQQARAGVKQAVRVSGLAEGERVVVRINGTKAGQGVASQAGRFNVRAATPRKAGKAKVVVVGQFANRRGTATYRVIR